MYRYENLKDKVWSNLCNVFLKILNLNQMKTVKWQTENPFSSWTVENKIENKFFVLI